VTYRENAVPRERRGRLAAWLAAIGPEMGATLAAVGMVACAGMFLKACTERAEEHESCAYECAADARGGYCVGIAPQGYVCELNGIGGSYAVPRESDHEQR
jgi:hypothetical protein